MDPGQQRVMNFYMDRVFGGDIIVEQNIHVIDMANWYLKGHPLKACGTGGRAATGGPPHPPGHGAHATPGPPPWLPHATTAIAGITSTSPSGIPTTSRSASARTS